MQKPGKEAKPGRAGPREPGSSFALQEMGT